MNILVTGAGGGVGQGIIKSLKLINDMNISIVAADASELAAGLYCADSACLVPRCDSEEYFKALTNIFKNESIDFYIPGTDTELKFCAKHKKIFQEKFNVRTIISSLEVIEICDDKYKTSRFLEKNNLNFPKTSYLRDININEVVFPVIVKPSIGCRSIGVFKVDNIDGLMPHFNNPEEKIVQECVGNDDEEYTCTLVKIGNEMSPVLVLKRILRSGDTYRAEPIKSKKIEDYVLNVASKLDIDGGCNFQLRIDDHGAPKIFEINSRFSGTTPFCSQIGFNPVEFYLKKSCELDCVVNIDYDLVLLRYWSEALVKRRSINKLMKNKKLKPNILDQFNLFS